MTPNTEMMARQLLRRVPKGTDLQQSLADSRLTVPEIIEEYRSLLDTTEESSVKRQILDSIAKIAGLMTPDEAKAPPAIIINIQGDNTKIAAMVCPSSAGAV